MDSANPSTPGVGGPSSGPGSVLQKARQDLRLAPEDVAQILHLSSKQIVALEQDDYKNLPGPTYVRGYLRSYAQLLGLSPEKIVESYNALTIPSKPLALPQSAPPPQVTSDHRLVKAATTVVAAIVLGLVYIWWRTQGETPEHASPPPVATTFPAPTNDASTMNREPPPLFASGAAPATASAPTVSPTEPPKPVAPSHGAASSKAPSSSVKPGAAGENFTASGMILNVSPGEPSKSPSATTAPRLDRAVAQARRAADIPADMPRSRLVLHAEQESWADVRDARDNKLLYENIPAGRTVTIEGVPPFSVFLGNADGVRVEYNGKNFDFGRYKRGQVARFTLGENAAENN